MREPYQLHDSNIREKIIELLNKPTFHEYSYLDLITSLNTVSEQCGVKSKMLDMWFKGVIESLYYRPNHYVLVLLGNERIGKSEFFRRLLPDKSWLHQGSGDKMTVFEYPIILFDEGMTKNQLDLCEKDVFLVRKPYTEMAVADKRISSYCCTSNVWRHPQRKNYLVLKLESINQELFNSIDKLSLWTEIFHKFKPEEK